MPVSSSTDREDRAAISRHRHTLAYRIVATIFLAQLLPFAFLSSQPIWGSAALVAVWAFFVIQQSLQTLELSRAGIALSGVTGSRFWRWSDVTKVTVTYAWCRTTDRISEVRLRFRRGRAVTLRMNWRDRPGVIQNLWPILGQLASRRALHHPDEFQDPVRRRVVPCEIETRVWPPGDW